MCLLTSNYELRIIRYTTHKLYLVTIDYRQEVPMYYVPCRIKVISLKLAFSKNKRGFLHQLIHRERDYAR